MCLKSVSRIFRCRPFRYYLETWYIDLSYGNPDKLLPRKTLLFVSFVQNLSSVLFFAVLRDFDGNFVSTSI